MTMQRTQVRTPRRRKAWAGFHTFVALDGGGGPELEDVLDQTFTDLGIGNMAGVTVMRMVGFIQLVHWTGTASTPEWENIRLGFAWLDQRLSTASGGSGLVPRPSQNGTRETRWYQQMVLGGINSGAGVEVPLNGDAFGGFARKDFDLTNMQKQPNADAKFNLVWLGGSAWNANEVALQCEIDILLALP